jgi:hypothetical protein
MMGVPLPEPLVVLGDNQSVIFDTSQPELMLKKSNLICYHDVRESVEKGKILTGHVPSKLNLNDLLTKILFGRRKCLVSRILEDIYNTFPKQ